MPRRPFADCPLLVKHQHGSRRARPAAASFCFAMFSIGLSVDADNGHIGAQRSKLSSGGDAYSGAEIPFHACPQPFNKPTSRSSSSEVPNTMSPKTRRQYAIKALDLWAY